MSFTYSHITPLFYFRGIGTIQDILNIIKSVKTPFIIHHPEKQLLKFSIKRKNNVGKKRKIIGK